MLQPSDSSPRSTSAQTSRGLADAHSFRAEVEEQLLHQCLKDPGDASSLEVYWAMAAAVRGRLAERWMRTQRTYFDHDVKRAYYLSSEFLPGRGLGLSLLNLGLHHAAAELGRQWGFGLSELLEREGDPGLGNGGLGRLAACFMDSLATLNLPAVGYGIRYEYGIFEQRIEHGQQVEHRDDWLHFGNPWEIARHDHAQIIQLYGYTQRTRDEHGTERVEWLGARRLIGLPYDSFVLGHGTDNVNTLRLWAARATRDFDLRLFNAGDYRRAVDEKVEMENISKVLYPDDHTDAGKELRLKQQYFFVACSIADIVRRYKRHHQGFELFADRAAIQLNDTHPAIAVAELLRVLIDQEGLGWEQAFDISRRTFGFTNHSLLPEALEKWPVGMFGRLLPRHLELLYELNHRFMREVMTRWPNDPERATRMSLFEEGPVQRVRMAHLAMVGSHSINGVAKLHTSLMQSDLFADFYALWPERFNNKTNGITPRRWLLQANPRLSAALERRLGPSFFTQDLRRLEALREYAGDTLLLDELSEVKTQNKRDLSELVRELTKVELDPQSMFVCHVKRIHEYKRQLLACLEIIARYLELKQNPEARRRAVPRSYLFAGKAAPGYAMAKLHIRLLNNVAAVINADPETSGLLRMVFIPNYGVSLAQKIVPAADVSLQISLAGKEASGTGNMKLALNGALTIGTLDGANIEIREAVGAEHFFSFGLEAPEVSALRGRGYDPSTFLSQSAALRGALDLIEAGFFSMEQRGRFHPITWQLRTEDPYLLCADFEAYLDAHRRVDALYPNPRAFSRAALFNIAGASRFSSDATIAAYASEIWDVHPTKVERGLTQTSTLAFESARPMVT